MMQKQKKLSARILSLALSVAMVLTMFPATIFAAEGDASPGTSGTPTTTRTITAFDELGEGFSKPVLFDGHTYMRNVARNTTFEEVGLPTELGVTVEKTTATTPPAKDATPTDEMQDSGQVPKQENTPVTETIQETISVTWQGDKEYTPAENSEVIHTAVLPEGYALADSAKLPTIHVMVGRQAPVPRSARAGLTEGQLYYFDLSSEASYIGTISNYLMDQTLHYVPFIYVGSVEAYSLDASSSGVIDASDKADGNLSYRTLFMSPRNVSVDVSWDKLNGRNLIFGKNFDGNNYTLRSLSGGNHDAYPGASPKNNEWDKIRRISERYLENYHTPSWVQDTSKRSGGKYRALRGKDSVGNWIDKKFDRSGESGYGYGFRPALQVKNPGSLKAVTLHLNGGYLSKYTEITSMNIVCGGDTFTAPSRTNLTRPNNGNYFEWNTRSDGSGDSYAEGDAVPRSVTSLYALWVKPTPAIKVAAQTGTATYGTESTPTYAVTATNFSGSYPEFAPSVTWTDGNAPTGVTTAFTESNAKLTITTSAETPAGNHTFKVVSAKTGGGNYESAVATLKVDKLTATITWGSSSFTYDGNSQAPTATVSNKVGSDEVIVTVIGEKTNAGSHTATADTLTGTAALNYELPTTKPTQGFTIAQKPVTTTLASGSVTKVYDGTTAAGAGTITLTTSDILAGDGGVTVTPGNIPVYSDKAVGTAYSLAVPVVLNSDTNKNYTLTNPTVAVTGEITAKPVNALNNGTLKITKEYDSTTTTGKASGALSSDDFVLGDDVGASATTVGAYLDATVGTGKTVDLTVKLTGAAAGNYSLANDKYSFTTAEITKAKPNVKVTAAKKAKSPSSGNIGSRDDTFVITATVTGVTGEKPSGTVQLQASGTAIVSALTLTNGVATYEWVTPAAGTYIITADFTATADTNYTNATGTSAEYGVSKVDQATLTFTGVPTIATYGDNQMTFATTGGSGTGAVSYKSSEPRVIADDGTIKGKGTATITATKAGDNGYNAVTAAAIITVKPATPTLAWDSADVTQSLDYTGSEALITKIPAVTLKNSESYSGTIKYSYQAKGSSASYTDGLPTNVGKYTIKAHIDAAGNYLAADSTNELTLTITKSSPTVSMKSGNYTGKDYDGTPMANPSAAQMDITGASYDNVTFTYSTDSAMSNPSATAPTDAGTYYVQAHIADTANTTAVVSNAHNFIINKTAYTATAITGTKWVKENTAQTGAEFDLNTLTFPAGFKDKTFKSTAIDTNTDVVLTGTPSIAGTQLTFDVGSVGQGKSGVIGVVVGSKNYNDYTVKITVTTVDKIPLSITATAVTGLVYNGTAQKGYTAVSIEGNKVPMSELDFTYSGTDKNGTAYGPTTTPPTKAGDYKLVVSVKSSNPTYVGTSSDIAFTIGQKELTVKADNRTMINGGALPPFTVNSSGFIAPDTAVTAFATQPLASCTADGKSIGTFDITISTPAALNTGVGANYSIKSQDKGTLTVNTVPHTGGSSSGSGNTTPPPTVVTPDPTTPAPPTTVETETPATVDKNGNASVTVSDKTMQDAIDKAVSEAKKNGTSDNGVAVVINVTTDGRDAHTVMVNLPKTLQEKVIVGKVSNTILAVDRPDITINLNLASVIEINKQAKSDVQIVATRMDSTKLSGEAKTAIAGRPTYDLNATYARGSKSVNSFGNGSVTVEIPYTLQEGEVAEGLYAVYVDENGEVSDITNSSYDAAAEVMRFATNHFSVYGIGYKAPIGFTDIANHWAKTDIEFVVSRGLFSGISNTIFAPNGAMTRGMFVTVLGRLANADVSSYKTSSFSDVTADAYYMGYIEWASKNGIVKGMGDGRFAPDQSITREQMAVIIASYAKAIGYTLPNVHPEKTFVDEGEIGTWAKDSVKKVQMAGMISGKSGLVFDPQGTATRAEVSAVFHRLIERARINGKTIFSMIHPDDVVQIAQQ